MDAQTVRSELERSDFFRGLDAAALNAMIQSASVQRLRPGQVLLWTSPLRVEGWDQNIMPRRVW